MQIRDGNEQAKNTSVTLADSRKHNATCFMSLKYLLYVRCMKRREIYQSPNYMYIIITHISACFFRQLLRLVNNVNKTPVMDVKLWTLKIFIVYNSECRFLFYCIWLSIFIRFFTSLQSEDNFIRQDRLVRQWSIPDSWYGKLFWKINFMPISVIFRVHSVCFVSMRIQKYLVHSANRVGFAPTII